MAERRGQQARRDEVVMITSEEVIKLHDRVVKEVAHRLAKNFGGSQEECDYEAQAIVTIVVHRLFEALGDKVS